MNAAKPLASLSSGLLARKGAARPAMRSQLALTPEEHRRVVFSMDAAVPAYEQDDLGWNDMGDDISAAVAAQLPEVPVAPPVIVQQLEELAAAVADLPSIATQHRMKGGKLVRSALAEGRKAAFTLRLDQYRHLRLRLACTLESRSAQSVLIEALDRFLADQPEVETIARRATRN